MEISYSTTKHFHQDDLQELFLSVQWDSGFYPKRLVDAMKGSSIVLSAWHGNRLVGLLNAMDDGSMNAYIHYLLVHPDYQKNGIGQNLMEMMKEHYHTYLNLILISYPEQTDFYQQCGFESSDDKVAMFFTNMQL